MNAMLREALPPFIPDRLRTHYGLTVWTEVRVDEQWYTIWASDLREGIPPLDDALTCKCLKQTIAERGWLWRTWVMPNGQGHGAEVAKGIMTTDFVEYAPEEGEALALAFLKALKDPL